MDINRSDSLLQNDAVVTFIVAATRYCALVEPLSTPEWTEETMRDCRVILADLYSATLHLPELQSSVNYTSGDPERVVTEESYTSVRRRLERFFRDRGSISRCATGESEILRPSRECLCLGADGRHLPSCG